ncbi:retrovirus-related Pol polyprotein from transposon opus [Trichonephila clavipes]|nr:retrovirus-related Pol polyprotein from transposon opus [Trichonephila clavipes]
MGPKKTLERIKYSFFWEGLRADVKKFCESCKACQLTRKVRIKDRSSSTPVARPELPFEVGNMDLIGPIDPSSLKGHKYIFYVWLISTLGGACKEQLPAPGNRSNERRYREKDLATTEEKKVGTGEKREGDEKSRGREK